MEHSPNIEPVAKDQLRLNLGYLALRTQIKVSQPTPQELQEMLELAEELPFERRLV